MAALGCVDCQTAHCLGDVLRLVAITGVLPNDLFGVLWMIRKFLRFSVQIAESANRMITTMIGRGTRMERAVVSSRLTVNKELPQAGDSAEKPSQRALVHVHQQCLDFHKSEEFTAITAHRQRWVDDSRALMPLIG